MKLQRTYSILSMRTIFIVSLFLFCSNAGLKAQETNYKAYSLYVYNFMKYVEWPENKSQGDFVIVMLGHSGIEKELNLLATQKKLKGRNIVVRIANTVDEIKDCQLVYIAESKSNLLKEVNLKLKGNGILIVGEKDGAANKGACLSFATLDNDELSFDINKKSLDLQHLKISGTLIKLGSVVSE